MQKLLAKPFLLTSLFLVVSILLGLSPFMPTSVLSGAWLTLTISLTSLTFLIPLICLLYRIHRFQGKSVLLFLLFFVEGVVLFGCSYFLLSYLDNIENIHLGFAGINSEVLSITSYSMFISLIESVYFSLLTLITLGYAHVYPESLALLLLTSAQISLGLYTVAIGVRSVFSVMASKKRVVENESKKAELRFAAHEDVFIFINRLISLFVELHRQSVADKGPDNIQALFTKDQMKAIYQNLDLNAKSSLNSELDWWSYLADESKAICAYGEQILTCHERHVEPEIYKYVQQLSKSVELSMMSKLPSLKNMPVRKNIPPVFGSNCLVPRKTFLLNIISIYSWCIELKSMDLESNNKIQGLLVYNLNMDRENPPRSLYKPACKLSSETVSNTLS